MEKVIRSVEDGFAFMMTMPEEDGSDETAIDKEIRVNAIVCSATTEQDNSVNHDTEVSRHIFYNTKFFHDYTLFESPPILHGFGTSLTTQAVGKGKIIMKSIYNGIQRNFSVSNALHIPTAQCNLISGSHLDWKRVNTQTGKGKITYFNAANVPFATGTIVRDLYKMDVEIVEADGTEADTDLITAMAPSVTTPDLFAAMVPSIVSLFGPGNENEETKKLGFSTV
jgi:hypothetical protein